VLLGISTLLHLLVKEGVFELLNDLLICFVECFNKLTPKGPYVPGVTRPVLVSVA
jgi:hypothetical protein